MTDRTIEIILEGFPEDGGNALLEVFANQIQHVKNALRKLNENSNVANKKQYKFKIVDLSHNSPATIKISEEYTGDEKSFDERYSPLKQFDEMMKNPKAANNNALTDYKKICSESKKLKIMKISLLDQTYEIDEERRETAKNLICDNSLESEIETAYSYVSYEGMVEKINIHAGKNEFFIFPVTGPKKIKCNFPEKMRNEVIKAVGRKACVKGKGAYINGSNFPNEIEVENITLFKQVNKEKLNFEYFSGTLDKPKDEKSSEELIREIRNEWD